MSANAARPGLLIPTYLWEIGNIGFFDALSPLIEVDERTRLAPGLTAWQTLEEPAVLKRWEMHDACSAERGCSS